MWPLFRIPVWIQWLGKRAVWRIGGETDTIYITFDDGPTPGITDKALAMLHERGARATFFCLGKNIQAYPELYQAIVAHGHTVGHHTWSHPDASKVKTSDFYRDYLKGKVAVGSDLFRPPYGRLTWRLTRKIRTKDIIVMWDIMPMDFDLRLPVEYCLKKVLRNLRPGSIVVLHDSLKAGPRMLEMLPTILDSLESKGWKAESLAQLKNSSGIFSAQLSRIQPGAQGR